MKRIIIVHWNRQVGPEPVIQYPPEKSFPPKNILLKIWSMHELNQDSIIEFSSDDNPNGYISIMQEHGGEIYFLILIRKKSEIIKDHTDYSDILAIISKNLIELLNTNRIARALFEAFNTIKNYTKLEKEENLLSFFTDKIKFTILQILRNGVISKAKLIDILKVEHGFSTINIDLLIISFLRENLILKKEVPGGMEDYFLIKDLFLMRIPPIKLPDFLKKLEREELQKVRTNLMSIYSDIDYLSDLDNKELINLLIDKDVISLLKILREKTLLVIECLNVLNNNEDLFNELIEKKIIFEHKGKVYLFSDLRFVKFTPYFIIKKLLIRYKENEISTDEFFLHLNLLADNEEYYEII